MTRCDVIVAGGGPAGSSCAWALRQADLDVIVVDRAVFPRDKVCAGWIPPQVLPALRVDPAEYRRGRTFQPFTAFRVGMIGDRRTTDVAYGEPVSYGIRRCEFDTYLLERSAARLQLGTPVARVRRDGAMWVVDDAVTAPMLVGAGGHFCAVGRMLNGARGPAGVVVAQEAEFEAVAAARAGAPTLGTRPELYFSPACDGYGWCVRKGDYLNVGFGHLDHAQLSRATAGFAAFLKRMEVVPEELECRWQGHAYALYGTSDRRLVDAGVVLIGDAAGLASPHSGEGIRPAIESGLMAASAIIEARGRYTADQLATYEVALHARFGTSALAGALSRGLPPRLATALAPWLLRAPWFVRHVLLDRWFLHV